MTLSFLRPAILIALAAASLAGCGGKATFEITGVVVGQAYPGLVLVEPISGQTISAGVVKLRYCCSSSGDAATCCMICACSG